MLAKKIEVTETVDAKKIKINTNQAMKLVKECSELWIARGQKVLHYDLKKEAPTKAELEPLIMGRSGNLRAPTFRKGKKMFVGFSSDGLKEFL